MYRSETVEIRKAENGFVLKMVVEADGNYDQKEVVCKNQAQMVKEVKKFFPKPGKVAVPF